MSVILDCAGRILDLRQPRVMGILNVTPDSFSDGGDFLGFEQALKRARQMVAEGAEIIDVGGESTRPGAPAVSVQQELDRVIPLIECLAQEIDLPISIDTSKPIVMREAAMAGAGMINDVNALRAEGALAVAAESSLPICLMHMQGEPRTMQAAPRYDNVQVEVASFLEERVAACEAVGISRDKLLLDPGFGFGKTLEHNLALFNGLPELASQGLPLLVGVSRKSMIGAILDAPVEKRLHGGVALATLAVWWGAAIIRTHDVQATTDAIKVCQALKQVG